MLRHFEKLKTPLKSVFTYPSLETQRRRFSSLGWGYTDVVSLWQIWSDNQWIPPEERRVLDRIEPFDEWEEFALFASHYCVVTAKTHTNDTGSIGSDGVTSLDPIVSVIATPTRFDEYERSRGQRRFGAAMTFRDDLGQKILANTFGLGTNSRLRSYDLYSQRVPLQNIEGYHPGPPGRMCHTITDLGSHGTLLSGGRASPASAFQDCWLFNKGTRSWTKFGDLPVPLYRHAVTRLGHSNMALLIGGKTGSSSIFGGCLLFCPGSGWVECQILGSDYRPVFGASAVGFSEVYLESTDGSQKANARFRGILAGGLLDDGIVSKQLLHWELLLPANDGLPIITFKRLRCQETNCPRVGASKATDADLLVNRFGSSTFLYGDNRIVIIGGVIYGGILSKECEILVIEASQFEFKILATHCPAIPSESPTIQRPLLIGASISLAKDGSLVIMGGGATCFSMGTCWNNGCYSMSLADLDKDDAPPYIPSGQWKFVQLLEVTEPPPSILSSGIQSNNKPITKVDIPRVHVDSKSTFLEVMKRGKPVIIEGKGPGTCIQTWTAEYLAHKIGHERKVSNSPLSCQSL